MDRCNTCKYWKRRTEAQPPIWGDCLRMQSMGGKNLVYIKDGYMVTQESFGCVLHRPRD